jgi:hypothetical protein
VRRKAWPANWAWSAPGELADALVARAVQRRVDQAAVLGPDLADQRGAAGAVRLAVGLEVAVDEGGGVGHGRQAAAAAAAPP